MLNRTCPIFVFLLLSAVSCSHQSVNAKPAKMIHAWTELGENGQLLARAIVNESKCPSISIEEEKKIMTTRGSISQDFPVKVCELAIAGGAKKLEINGIKLATPNLDPQKIVILGDTGCRLKKDKKGRMVLQACNDPNEWPFSTIAKAAAEFQPDLVIHVGDYHYRETACPDDSEKCRGSPFGDRWEVWRQDFFEPAKPLLASAPWAFVRGNHEICRRAGNGWTLFLSPFLESNICSDQSLPFQIPLNGFSLSILDSADEKNFQVNLEKISQLSNPLLPIWIFTHRPFLTPGADDEAKLTAKIPEKLLVPGQVSAVFTGHTHVLSINRFNDQRPPEIITGNSGSALDTKELSYIKNSEMKIDLIREYGFLTLEKQSSSDWIMTARDRSGLPKLKCDLKTKIGLKSTITCQSL